MLENLHNTIYFIANQLWLTVLIMIIVTYIWRKHDFKLSFKILKIITLFYWGLVLFQWLNYFYRFGDLPPIHGSGNYWWGNLFTTIGALFSPILLFHKKWGQNKWILLAVAFWASLGRNMELFVIVITSFHSDYGDSSYLLPYLWHHFVIPGALVLILTVIDLTLHHKTKDRSDILD